jgi:hypothetical protein
VPRQRLDPGSARRTLQLALAGAWLLGAPGAVLLYALLAVLAWPSSRSGSSLASSSVLGRGALAAWVALWGSELYLALPRGNDSAARLRDSFAGLADGEPGWLARLDGWAAGGAADNATIVAVALAILLALTLLAVFLPAPLARPLLGLSLVLSGLIWVAAQNFGGILTGQATDPDTGPILMLVVLAYRPFGGASYVRTRRPWPIAAAVRQS